MADIKERESMTEEDLEFNRGQAKKVQDLMA